MPSRFYLDEDVPLGLKHELQAAGHNVVHARDLTAGRRTDASHLLIATRDRRMRDLYLAIDVFLQSNLPVANQLYTYDPAVSWVVESYVP